jgi:PIN domain nuclease of toxin-antitoxin system
VTEATTAVVADTHIVIWYVLNPAKLNSEAAEALEGCVAAGGPIGVSAYEIANRVASVPQTTNADPGDRILVATAEVLGFRIVSADSRLPGMTSFAVIA